jgi:branched-chain amino acid transport system substrate-binding protein
MKKICMTLSMFLFCGCSTIGSVPVKIGAILPLSGGMADVGIELQKLLIAEVEGINEQGGVLDRQIELIFEDGQCNAGVATAAAQKLIRMEKVSVILGGLCSPETLGAAPVAEKNKTILITSVSGAESISDAGDFVFRNAPEGDTNGKIMAHYAHGKGFQKVLLISEISDFPISVTQAFRENFTGKIVEEEFAPGTTDFRTLIAKVQNEKGDALFFNPQQNQSFVLFMKQLQEAQWSGPLLFNNTVVGNPALYEDISDFMIKNNAVAGSYDVIPNAMQDAVLSRFEARWDRPALFRHLLANQKDSLSLILQAIGSVGNEKDTEGIRDFLYSVKDFTGASGTFSIDLDGDVGKSYELVRFDGEAFVSLENAEEVQKPKSLKVKKSTSKNNTENTLSHN